MKEVRNFIDVQKEIQECPLDLYGERIAVVEEEITQVGNLYVPETSRKGGEMQTNEGYVVAVGPYVEFVVPGDKVVYGRYSGGWFFNNKYRVMNEEDLIAKMKSKGGNGGGC